VNSKPPTIPFGIVACTFSDNLSRNSCIRQPLTHPAKKPVWLVHLFASTARPNVHHQFAGFSDLSREHEIQNGFQRQEICPQDGFHGFPSLLFYWEVWKRICKPVSMKSGLFLLIIRHVPARLLFFRTVCQSPSCPYFPKTAKKRKSKDRFLAVEIHYPISCFTFNLKSGHQNINLACPIKSTLSRYFPRVVIIGRLGHVHLP